MHRHRFFVVVAAIAAALWFGHAEATSRFVVNNTAGCTGHNWNGASCWCTVTGGAGGTTCGGSTGIPAAGDTVTCDGNSGTGTFTVDVDPASLGSLTVSACSLGTFDNTANHPFTITTGNFACNGASTTVLSMGSATYTFAASGTNGPGINIGSTCSPNFSSSNIVFSGSTTIGRNFIGNGHTFNDLTVTANSSIGANTNTNNVSITGANTFHTVTISGPEIVFIPNGATTTVNDLVLSGTSGNPVYFASVSATNLATLHLSSGLASSCAWAALYNITMNTNTLACTNTTNLGGVSGWGTISAPAGGGGGGGILGNGM